MIHAGAYIKTNRNIQAKPPIHTNKYIQTGSAYIQPCRRPTIQAYRNIEKQPHMQADREKYTHRNRQAHTVIHTYTDQGHTHIHTYIHTYMPGIYTYRNTCKDRQRQTYRQADRHPHIHRYWHTYRDIHTYRQRQTQTDTDRHSGTYGHTYGCIHTYIHTRTHIHTYIHTYIHTCIHTYSQPNADTDRHKHTHVQ